MPSPVEPVAQEPHRGEHCPVNPTDDDEQMGEINVIFRGSMSIASKRRKEARVGDQLGSVHRT
jgi:hypothetical protein